MNIRGNLVMAIVVATGLLWATTSVPGQTPNASERVNTR